MMVFEVPSRNFQRSSPLRLGQELRPEAVPCPAAASTAWPRSVADFNAAAPSRMAIKIVHRQFLPSVVIVVQGKIELLHVVRARGPSGCFASLLNGGQQQSDQHADDGDDNR